MKIRLKLATACLATSLSIANICAAPQSSIKIEHLGTNNTLVRVDDAAHYILLPVQESYDDATVNVLVDGKLERTIYVRLAKTKVDYTVPFDLTPYKGHDVVFNIVTAQHRSSIREVKEEACWSNFSVTDTIDVANHEKYRPAFHHSPLYGWMNDPNGMVYENGVWHLYYQHNPYGSKWQNMHWGHSTSTDLINWEHQPEAIAPNGIGTVFSGSCAIDKENSAGFGKDAILALYTSAGVSQVQSLGYSHDHGQTFELYAGNPVLTLEREARDPNMFWNAQTKQWTLILAHALDKEMLIFTSPNMKEWTLQSSFGKGLGAQDGVWECPDLFELPVQGTNQTKWVLICNINPGGPYGGSGAQYFIGNFDGKTFKADTDANGQVPTKWLDYGKDHYAIVSWSDAPDNRRTMIGWMNNWQYAADVPTMQFRSANTLPREIELFTANDGQVYAASVPARELINLRDKLTKSVKSTSVGKSGQKYALPATGLCEILMDIEPGRAQKVNLSLSNKRGDAVLMTYNTASDSLSFDRTHSGIVDFSNDFPAVTTAPIYSDGKLVSLRLFIDRASMEVFANEGKGAMTNIVFPTEPYTTLSVNADGGKAQIKNLKIYSIHSDK